MQYLDVTLEIPTNPKREITSIFLKNHVTQSLKQLFGERGADSRIDIIKYNPHNRNFIIRCKDKDYVALRAALTLASNYEEDNCVYIVNKSSPSPFGLLSDGRNYEH